MEKVQTHPHLDRMLQAVEAFRQFDPEMPAQTISVFLAIAYHGEISMARLKTLLGIAQSSVSRNVSMLSATTRHGKPGPNLLRSWENPDNRREKLVTLTVQGRRHAAILNAILGGSR